ncbi:hypothetical protein H6G76_12045 [Nostoc sp. FACHB-152]|uniref:hypothetical protein n=1 Tax=unclassified Nostoc TaxID=2593658 RepID=UPI001688D65E|nr:MULTISPECIES: hypothetical protein [unclassified Nostoc]MBD2447895.1 hypothetical protein [Nostoc sp. FACHB-152]MBD2468531.1 hypothetical protein [Nostoc sp. FACHB-145]
MLAKFNSALIIALIVTGLVVSINTSKFTSPILFGIQPAVAQRISPLDVWQQVYEQLPNLPKENKYISNENGKVAETNTLASRLIRYHIYVKERSPIYRLDWKLTLADYLGANETIYDTSYPGSDILRQNPLDGDRAAINRLSRQQRDALVQTLVNIFSPSVQNTSQPPSPSSNTPQKPQTGGAELLK